MRASTGEQSLDLQRDALAPTGCEWVYDDVCSGRAPTARLVEGPRRGARGRRARRVELDRFGRSLPHVVGFVGDLHKRGIGLKVLTGDVDTMTATGRLAFGIFATLAEFERDLSTSERWRGWRRPARGAVPAGDRAS